MRLHASWTVVAMGALVLLCAAPARADLWSWDQMVRQSTPDSQFQYFDSASQSGLTYRGTPGLPLPRPDGGGGTIGQISGSTGRGCGIDFASEFTALFNVNALESYFKGLASSAISAAPLVLMCYASPTLCDAYKHFKAMASGLLQARAAECQAVEQAAMGIGDKMAKKRELECIEEKTAAGVPRYQAQDDCRAVAASEIVGFDMKKVPNVNVIEDGLKHVGASPETQEFAKAILGDISFKTSGSGRQTELKKVPVDGVEREWGRLYQDYVDELTTLIDTVAQGGVPQPDALRKVSAPGVPITQSVLQQIVLEPPHTRAIVIQQIASALTRARLDFEFHRLRVHLAEAARSAAASNQTQEEIERQLRVVDALRARLPALKESQDDLVAVLRQMERRAAEERATARGRTPVVTVPDPHVDLGGGLKLRPR